MKKVLMLNNFLRGRPKKTWEEVIKMDLRERRVSKDLARDRLAWRINFLKTVQRMPACKTDVFNRI